MEIKKLFIDAAQENKAACMENESLANVKKTTIKKLVAEANKLCGTNADGKKIAKLAEAFLIGEMSNVIKEYPRLHKRQVIRLFEVRSLVKKNARIDSTAISRPFLIDLVELLEDYTGMKITDDSKAPLAYLDQKCGTLDIEDIADFFSGRRDSRILNIIETMKEIKTISEAGKRHTGGVSRRKVKAFLADSCGVTEEELDESKPINTLKPNLDCGPRPHYVVVYWAEGRFNKLIKNDFVETKTIGELIDVLAGK